MIGQNSDNCHISETHILILINFFNDATTLIIATLGIKTLTIKTLSIKSLHATLSIKAHLHYGVYNLKVGFEEQNKM